MTMALQTGFSTALSSRAANAPRFGWKLPNLPNLRGLFSRDGHSGDTITTQSGPSAANGLPSSGGDGADEDGPVTSAFKVVHQRVAEYHKTLTDKILAKVPQDYDGRAALEKELNAFGEELQQVLASIKTLVDHFKQALKDVWDGIMWHPPKEAQPAPGGATGMDDHSDDASSQGVVTA